MGITLICVDRSFFPPVSRMGQHKQGPTLGSFAALYHGLCRFSTPPSHKYGHRLSVADRLFITPFLLVAALPLTPNVMEPVASSLNTTGTRLHRREHHIQGCSCVGQCKSGTCVCLQESDSCENKVFEGKRLPRRLGAYEAGRYIECGPECTCSESCENRVSDVAASSGIRYRRTP
jgi:hypothetical protein